MTRCQEVDRFVQDLKQKGMNQYTAAPPLFRFLWSAGLEIPPPFFIGFLPLMLLMAVSFGTLFGVFIWLTELVTLRTPVQVLLLLSAAAGLLFGLIMAMYCRWKARRWGLRTWKEYGEA